MKTVCSVILGAACLLASITCAGQQAADLFKQSCTSCHTIGGGRLVGPDLKNVTQQKDRAWLVRFIQNPQAVISSGDAYALKLKSEAQGVVMPTLGIDAAQAEALLGYIEAQSKSPAAPAAAQTPELPFAPTDVAAGRALFTGARPLANGGPACISCHTVRDLGGLSGGRLGPDLTLVYERLGGRRGLTAWLANPAAPTMTPIFGNRKIQPNEIQALIAFFQEKARQGGSDDASARLDFLLLGLGGAVIGLVAMDSIWKKRSRGVRRPLVAAGRKGKQ